METITLIEPTWQGHLNALLLIVQHAETEEARNEAIKEFRKMAICADKYLALMKDDAAAADDDGDYDHGREMQDEPHQYESDHSVRSYIYGDGKQQ
tara:strand:+ start:302 stop:589 length:288 start_codon:yes stop_codon:yes gene_type:complete